MEELILTSPGELNIKRCRMEGKITINCPECKNIEMTNDFQKNYLSYPEVGSRVLTYFNCEKCDGEFSLKHARITKIEIHIAFDRTVLEGA